MFLAAFIDPGWILPAAAVVWVIIQAVLKARQQGENELAEKPLVNRQPGSELDKFLAEIERLKQQQQAKSEPTAAPPPPPKPKPVVVDRPAKPKAKPAKPVQSTEAVQSVLPVLEALASPTASTPPQNVALIRTAGTSQRSDLPNIVAMLRSPSGLRNAVILQEIFGPPKSRKRR